MQMVTVFVIKKTMNITIKGGKFSILNIYINLLK